MRRVTFVLAMVALAGMAAFAQAGVISWGTAQNITGDSDVVTTGTLVHAYSGNAATVNDVAFTADWVGLNSNGLGANMYQQVSDTFGGGTGGDGNPSGSTPAGYYVNKNASAFGSTSAPFSSLSPEYQNLLKGALYADHADTCTYTIGGLTEGNDYLVQVWTNDARQYNRSLVLDGVATIQSCPTAVPGGPGQFVVGSFTATGTTQTFTAYGDTVVQINAIQLRDVTVPEPGTLALLGAGLVGLLCYA